MSEIIDRKDDMPASDKTPPPGAGALAGKVVWPGERHSLSRSATRALDVLELFGEARRPLRAVEMSKALGVHPSSMNQLLKTMVESAHLTFEAQFKTYLPSLRLARFSAWMLTNYSGERRFRDLLGRVHKETGAVVTLTTPNDVYMQVIDVVGVPPTGAATERGLRVSLFGSATGRAYLSTLPRAEIVRLATRARISGPDLDPVLEQLAEVRRSGHADGPSLSGAFWSVAMPLPVELSPAPLVLGLAGPVDRIRQDLAGLRDVMRQVVRRWLDDDALAPRP